MLLGFNLLLLIINFVFSGAVNPVAQDGIYVQCCFFVLFSAFHYRSFKITIVTTPN